MSMPPQDGGGTVQYCDSRNVAAIHESTCIALLNRVWKFSFKKASKRSVLTLQFLKIDEMQKQEDIVSFNTFIDERVDLLVQEDVKNGISEETAKRRIVQRRIVECNKLLVDILREEGMFVETKTPQTKTNAPQIEIIENIFPGEKNGVLTKEMIKEFGEEVNRILSGRIQKGILELEIGDEEISFIVNKVMKE